MNITLVEIEFMLGPDFSLGIKLIDSYQNYHRCDTLSVCGILQNCMIEYAIFNKNCILYHAVLYFATHRLFELAKEFYQNGGKKLYIDEIHKYDGCSSEIKNISYLVKDDIEYASLREIPLWMFGFLY